MLAGSNSAFVATEVQTLRRRAMRPFGEFPEVRQQAMQLANEAYSRQTVDGRPISDGQLELKAEDLAAKCESPKLRDAAQRLQIKLLRRMVSEAGQGSGVDVSQMAASVVMPMTAEVMTQARV